MADEQPTTEASAQAGMRETFGLDQYQFTLGKWIVLLSSIGMMVAGLILSATSDPEPEFAARSTTVTGQAPAGMDEPDPDGLMNSFADNGGLKLPIPDLTNGFPDIPEPGSAPDESPADTSIGSRDFSKLFVKGGFGMFMGFAIGFAIRAFVKLATVIVGFYFLTLVMLSYLGWIEIHWHVIEGQFNGLVTNLGAQFESFKAFLTGSIPSSGAAATGLAMGLRKK